MRIFFAFMVLGSAALTGCYDMHGRDGIEPPPVPMGDAGPMPIGDAGEMPEPDGGPMVEPDADVPSEFVLVVDPFYSGWRTPPARQDMATSHIRVTARRNVEWDGGLWFQISTETPGCMVRGSAGTEYFRDLKVKNLATGETMMGPASIPSTEPPGSIATGFFRIGAGDARVIPAGTTLEFAVTMDLAAVEDAPGEFLGCDYAVHTGAGTIIDPSAVRLVGGERLRPDQIDGDNVASYSGFTVDASIPEFEIAVDNLRQSTILVAGGDVWHNVAQYRVGPDESIANFILSLDGDAADIQEVAIAADGYVLGTGRFPSGIHPVTGIRPSEPFVTPSDSSRIFQVWVRVPSVVSGASVSGATVGVPRSGDSFRVGIGGVEHYIGSALVTSGFDPIYGNEFVIRRSKPTFTRLPLTTSRILNGEDQDLYRFQVSADSAGSIGLRAVRLDIGVTSAVGRVCNVRIRRGPTELSRTTDYFLRDGRMGGSESCWSMSSGTILVYFRNEETVTGSGNAYTIFGTPEGFVAGDSIATTLVGDDGDDGFVTGYIGGLGGFGQSIDTSPWGTPSSTCNGDTGASLIWSDLSEVPHIAAIPCGDASRGSRDWTNGYLIEDLTQTQILSL